MDISLKDINLEDIVKFSIKETISDLKTNGFLPENFSIDKFVSSIIKGIYLDKQSKKRLFYKIGREYYNIYVHFYTLVDAIDLIEEKIISSINFCSIEIIDFIWEYFEFVKNQIAYGYLISMVNSDKDLIRKELKAVKGKSIELKDLLREYLIWANKISEDIKKLRVSKDTYIKYVPMLNIENEKYLKLFKKEDIVSLKDVHNRLVNIAFIIYTSISKRKFLVLTLAYMEYMKLISKFVSLASVNMAVKYSEETKLDPLTGIFNRKALDIIFPSQFQIAKLSNKPLTIAIIDLDNFKMINDTYGHIVGDCILKKVTDTIKKNLRESDFIFRYGGEEFLILLPFTPKKKACQILDKILNEIKSKAIICLNNVINVSFSGGVEDIYNVDNTFEMIENADRKLYEAKRTGKGKIVC